MITLYSSGEKRFCLSVAVLLKNYSSYVIYEKLNYLPTIQGTPGRKGQAKGGKIVQKKGGGPNQG